MRNALPGTVLGALLCLSGPPAAVAAPPGTVISNRAELHHLNSAGQPSMLLSNEVQLVTAVIRSPSAVTFTRLSGASSGTYRETVGPSACLQSGSFVTLPDPLVNGQPVDPLLAQDLVASSGFNLGETVFFRLADPDQNLDATVIDYAQVMVVNTTGGDTERLRLAETGIDSGIFAGYLPTANGSTVSGDCLLQGFPGERAEVRYADPADNLDNSVADAGFDPSGVVFDSTSGAPVDGVTVQLVDAASGQPAPVYGNDGVSLYPSSVVSGQAVSDSGGNVYLVGPGQYRLPSVPAGDYRVVISASGYSAPSTAAVADLQLLPDAPFVLPPASFGTAFSHAGQDPFGFDLPVDPQISSLFLRKSTTTTIAAPGDFVRYELTVENPTGVSTADDVVIRDRLPSAMRFVAGSVMHDGVAAGDPVIDESGRQLEFAIGVLAGGERRVISYVAEIVGGTRDRELVNTATAVAAGGLASNEAEARIRIAEDLFRSSGTLIGRVAEGDCIAPTIAEDRGVSGVRVYLEDGRYAVTDDGGRFHFEGLPPGGHVVQLDRQTVPGYFLFESCARTGRFAGRGDSQFVELSRGALKRADFRLKRKEAPEGRINIDLANSGVENADEVAYDLTLRGNGNVGIDNLSVMVLLPDGVRYRSGSLLVDGEAVGEPRISGQTLVLPLADRSMEWRSDIRFTADLAPDASGELRTRALARFDSPVEAGQQTPVAETLMVREPSTSKNEGYVLNLQFDVLSAALSPADRAELDHLIESWHGVTGVQLAAVGHSDSARIAPANRHLFADNYALSAARARAVADYVAHGLNVPETGVQVEGRGADDPLASNDTTAGRQANRRVELILSGRRAGRQSYVRVTQPTSGTLIAHTAGLIPGVAETTTQLVNERALAQHLRPVEQVEPHINSLTRGISWLLPDEDYRPAIPAIKVAVKHAPGQTVAVFVNGLEVNPLNFDGQQVNARRDVVVSRWAGVDLLEGSNRIVAEVLGADGTVLERLQRSIHYAGAAVRAELMSDSSVLVADGRTRPVFAVRLFDRFGEPARQTSVGAFRVDSPYRSWWQVESDKENKIVSIGNREPLYTIGRDGIALIELEPTTESGLATLRFRFDNQREQEVHAWLESAPRDWILVGFGEGTAGYRTLSDNAVAAAEAGHEDGYYRDGRLAFFAKGSIKGEFLLTMAYDSARDPEAEKNRFLTNVDPDAYYALYADNTEQRFEAPSQRKLYVKLERRQFVASFGDFDTGLSTTDLTRYERRFNGFRNEFRSGHFSYVVFASETDQTYVRDELQGDGTSGRYRLSGATIISNSETVRIEVRDRFDTARVLSSRALNRYLDYDIDYFDGSLFFKQPVPSRDPDFNPVYIVAEYERAANGDGELIAGGRAAVHGLDGRVEIGASHIDDGQQGSGGELSGIDLRWQAGDNTVLRAELAESSTEVAGTAVDASARTISVEHRSDRLELRAYHREVDQQFGLGQQASADKGIAKTGLEGRLELNEELAVNAQASRQENLETGARRTVGDADVNYRKQDFAANLGVVHARDEFTGGETTSNLVDGGISQRLFDSALMLRANGSLTVDGDAGNGDYLSTFVVGADYEVWQGVNLFVEHERADGAEIEAEMSRVGLRATPWNQAQFNSSVVNEMSEYGPRLFASVGLIQGIQLNERWAVDLGVDQTRTLRGSGLRRFDDERELASGSLRDDFTAVSLGAMYQAEFWSANSRVEYRDSDGEQRASLISGWYREARMGHGLSAGLAILHSEQPAGSESLTARLRMGWARRIADSQWAFLDRIDLVYDDASGSDATQQTWRLINNFNANRRLGAAGQLSLQYAFKYVRAEFDALAATGYTDLLGVDFRRAFREKWDAGLNTSVYHSWRADAVDYGFGLDLGYNLAENTWLTLGYNVAGFYDGDFAQSRYTAQGPYLRISIKADQQTLKDIAGQRQVQAGQVQ